MVRHPAVTRLRRGALLLLPFAFLGYFFVYPLVTIIVTGLTGGDSSALSAFADVFSRRRLGGIVWFTVWQATASTLLTLLIALPATAALSRYDFGGRRLVKASLTVPFVLPTVVVATAFLALLGPGGPLGIDLRRTVWAILAAHVFYNVAVVVRTVGSAWERLDPRIEDAARVLGASPWRTFRTVTLPLLRPSIVSASSIVFLFTFTSFGVILILGGFSFATIETEIWRQATALIDFPVAAALAVLQVLGVTAILLLYSRSQRRSAVQVPLTAARVGLRRLTTSRQRWFVYASVWGLAALLAAPLSLLIARSFRVADGYGLDHYTALGSGDGPLFVPATTAVGNSLGFAVVATVVAVAVGMTASIVIAQRQGWLSTAFDTLLMLPLGTSAVTIGFGFLVALDVPIDLRTSIVLVPIAHALVATPFVVRTTVPVLRSVRRSLREAAAVLGASPAAVYRRIDLPIVTRAALVGAGFAFAVSLGEFGATLFIARPDRPTMPTAIFRLLSRPGTANFGQAMAMSTLLMVVTAGVILWFDRLRIGDLGEF